MSNEIAVVIGGSVAGMLSARVLSEHYKQVIIIERDEMPDDASSRRGVPQARHVHGLLKGGANIIADLFPGFFDELVEKGALALDACADMRAYMMGNWRLPFKSGEIVYGMSRPLLDWTLRRRLLAIPNVSLRDGYKVKGYQIKNKRITGLTIERDNRVDTLEADLIVDASGRGSRTPQWLDALGFGTVPTTELKVDVRYATRVYKADETFKPDWKIMIVADAVPGKCLGIAAQIENGNYIVTLTSKLGETIPSDDAGFLDFARKLPQSQVYDLIQRLEPMSEIIPHGTPSNLRHHYEKLASMPEGLIVLGDALCSFNPTFGQGMTASAQSAMVLYEELNRSNNRQDLTRRFYKAIPNVVDGPWQAATGEDMRHPEIGVPVPLMVKFMNWYIAQLHAVAGYDAGTHLAFTKVMNLVAPPTIIFAPHIVWKVIKQAFGKQNQARTTENMPRLQTQEFHAIS